MLLKNERDTLPLDPARLKSIAVIGPNAAVTRLGGYSGVADRPVSVVDGLRARLGDKVKVTTAPGCGLTTGNRGWADDVVQMSDPAEDAKLTAEAARVAAAADVVLLVLGQNEQLSREGWADNHQGDRTSLDLPGRQMELARAVSRRRQADDPAPPPRQPADAPRARARRARHPRRVLSGRGDRHRGGRRAVRRREPGGAPAGQRPPARSGPSPPTTITNRRRAGSTSSSSRGPSGRSATACRTPRSSTTGWR